MNPEMELQVSYAVAEDAEAIAQIHVDAWKQAYQGIVPADYLASMGVEQRLPWWRKVIESGYPELLVAKRQGVVQGWVNFGKSRDTDANASDGEIWAIYAKPDAWSTGVGRALWAATNRMMLERGFENCSLWVFPQNIRAIRFYESVGFVRDDSPETTFQLGGRQLKEVRYTCRLKLGGQAL